MSFNELLAELPSLTVPQRQLLVRRALELDDQGLPPADEAVVKSAWLSIGVIRSPPCRWG